MDPSDPHLPRLVIDLEVAEGIQGTVDEGMLEVVLAEALAGRTREALVGIGLTVTDDEGIQDLNREYRGIDAATDVLSFPLLDYRAPEDPKPSFPRPAGEPLLLGDIVLSYQRAVEQAEAYGHSLQREIAFLLVHGAMHLLGYDHEKPEQRERMRQEEEAVLGRLKLGRA